MEDEGFVDDAFIAETAREWVGRHGVNAIPLLRERVRIAEKAGDYLVIETWRGVLKAAEAMTELDPE
jgi:hypothetical protein